MGLALATLAGVTVLVALVSEVFVESVQQAAESFGLTPAFVGFIVVGLVGGAAEMVSAFSGARKNRLDLSVGIALGSSAQIALFVAPVLVLLSYFIAPMPMDLQFWPGAVAMMLIATFTATLVTNGGRSAWFLGVLVLMVYAIVRDDALPPATEAVIHKRVLAADERIAEVLFGLIMVLTFTGSLSVAEAGREDIRAMLIGALGCNVAWGVIDAVLYLMGCLAERGRDLQTYRAVREAADPTAGSPPDRRGAAGGPLVGHRARRARTCPTAAGATAGAAGPRAAERVRLARRVRRLSPGVSLDVPRGGAVHRHGERTDGHPRVQRRGGRDAVRRRPRLRATRRPESVGVRHRDGGLGKRARRPHDGAGRVVPRVSSRR